MKRRASWLLLALVVGALFAGLSAVYRLRLARGDVFPAYSTLRADPLGVRAWYESLRDLPGLKTERVLTPLDKLVRTSSRTIIFAGMDRDEWRYLPMADFKALDGAIREGSRVVVAFCASIDPGMPPVNAEPSGDKKKSEPAQPKKPKEDVAPPASSEDRVNAAAIWGLEVKRRWMVLREETGARRVAGTPATFADNVSWRSDLYFELKPGEPWRVLYTRAGVPVLVERSLGLGSIVVAADSFFLSNEALQRERATGLLAWLVGPNTRVVFHEAHLGLREESGIAALARRYGLAGAFFTALLFVALWVWQRMALFVPPAPDADELIPGHQATAGLDALLRRAVPPAQLARACFDEWRRSARAGDIVRVEAALPVKAAAPDAYNAAVRALKRR